MLKNIIKSFCSRRIIGLDIGTSSVKAVELRQTAQGYCLENYVVISLPSHDENELANAIHLVKQQLKNKTKNVVVGIADSLTIRKIIQLPANLSEKEIYQQICFDAEHYFSYPLAEICFDFQIMTTNKENNNLIDILLIASQQKNINKYVNVFHAEKLHIKAIEANSSAIARIAHFLNYGAEMICVVDVDIDFFVLNIIKDDDVLFTHEESYHSTETFITSVQRGFQLFLSSQPLEIITRILLTGKVDKLVHELAVINAGLQIPVNIADPLLNIQINPNVNKEKLMAKAAQLFLCLGLALRVHYVAY